MKINMENKQDLGAIKYYTTDHIYTYAINQLSAVNTTYHCVLLSWITRRHLTQYKPKQY